MDELTGQTPYDSSRGKTVDITAPAENVWKAANGMATDGKGAIRESSGTSFAVATTAGIAALWLAHHGRDYLINRYGTGNLTEAFRETLQAACDPPPMGHDGKFGAGIVNAEATLRAALLPLETTAPESLPELASTIAEVLEEDDDPAASAVTALLNGTAEARLSRSLADELLFHAVASATSPTELETAAAESLPSTGPTLSPSLQNALAQ